MIGLFRQVLKLHSFAVCVVVLTVILWTGTYYSLVVFKEVPHAHQTSSNILENNTTYGDDNGYLIKTSMCRIPEMYLNGPDIDKYMDYSSKINCLDDWNYILSLVTSNLTALILNTTTMAILNIDIDDPSFKCYYSSIERLAPGDKQDVGDFNDNEVKLGRRVYFKRDVFVSDEMVEVACTWGGVTVYRDHHVFIRPVRGGGGGGGGDDDADANSVLVLGIDAVSRLNFRRQMPGTSELLSRLGDVEMLGYNKVGDNTFPNLVPALTGLSVDELRARCWPGERAFFDACRFAWRDFRAAGYDTVFAEDAPDIGAFHYGKAGFAAKPADHYLRPLMLRAEQTVGRHRRGNVMACSGPRLAMATVLDYARKTALSMAGSPYMAVFWSSTLTHDYVEYPRYGDAHLSGFLAALNRSGRLDRTVVVLMSDHGIRWGPFRDTDQGGLEDRLPMLRLIVPARFRRAYPRAERNLRANAGRLTTPYDLHETLLDLADPARLKNGWGGGGGRGVSLFLEVPENRSCRTAGVPAHYCACRDRRTEVPAGDGDAADAATALVRRLNAVLSAYPQCANLTLSAVHRAAVETRRVGGDRPPVRYYEITVSTVPGHGKFEATVNKRGRRFRTVGSVSRLNEYGNQSVCVDDSRVKSLCYCER